MTQPQKIQLGIVLGRSARPQTVIEDLWRQAESCVSGLNRPLTAVVVYVDDGAQHPVPPGPEVTLVPLRLSATGKFSAMAGAVGRSKGIPGIVGRLLTENFYSRRVARALKVHPETERQLCSADVIVSADPAADRSVWRLRNRSSAKLMHGPYAMVNALRDQTLG